MDRPQMKKTIQTRLQKKYFCLLMPSIVIIAALLTARSMDLIEPIRLMNTQLVARVIFILAISLAVAAPVFLRTLFAHRMRLSIRTPPDEFFRLQQRLIGAALLTPYLILVTCLVDFPRFYQAGVISVGPLRRLLLLSVPTADCLRPEDFQGQLWIR